jgi:hypothetical protein
MLTLLSTETDVGKFYKVDANEVVEAETAADLLDHLWRTSRSPVVSKVAYRVRAATWTRELTGRPVRTYNDDVFLADMLDSGMWQEVTPPTKH